MVSRAQAPSMASTLFSPHSENKFCNEKMELPPPQNLSTTMDKKITDIRSQKLLAAIRGMLFCLMAYGMKHFGMTLN